MDRTTKIAALTALFAAALAMGGCAHSRPAAGPLTIRGELKNEEVQGRTRHRRERRTGSFFRSLTLPTNVNPDQVKADYRNGILTLTRPKREEAKPRTIKIQTAS